LKQIEDAFMAWKAVNGTESGASKNNRCVNVGVGDMILGFEDAFNWGLVGLRHSRFCPDGNVEIVSEAPVVLIDNVEMGQCPL
jgi:hypothetical protein